MSMRALTLVALVAAGCGVLSPEEQLLTRFFEASRLHDTTTVARLSSVTFDPRVEGVVQAFEVVETAREADVENLTVRATVREPDGQVVPKALSIALRRQDGRWFITAITPLRVSRTSRAAFSAPPY